MALHRGIQSAIFYYLSCAPCSDYRYRKRRRQEAERDRADREMLEVHMPGLYRHPEPSSTNPFWQAEIDAGPTPARTKKKTADSQRGKTSTTQSTGGSNVTSSVSLNAVDGKMERVDSAKGGLASFQRRDETLWGSQMDVAKAQGRLEPGESMVDNLPLRPAKARINDTPSLKNYQHSYNAAINDFHPPTTRKVNSKEEVMWMLQPPPVAEVMSGKEQAVSGQDGSTSSRPSATTSVPLSRQISQRLIDKKLQAGEIPMHKTSPDTIPAKSATESQPAVTVSPPPSQDNTHGNGFGFRRASSLPSHEHSRHLPPTGPHQSQEVRTYAGRAAARHQRNPSRPHLSTILSDSIVSTGLAENRGPEEQRGHGDRKQRTSDMSTFDVSDVEISPRPSFGDVFTQAKPPSNASPWMKTRVVVPQRDHADDRGMDPSMSSDALDYWDTPDFEQNQWIHEHTKREVRERWSFDI